MPSKYRPSFVEGYFYHVYTRSNTGRDLFYSDDNNRYFLQKWEKYLSAYLDVAAYCLLPNHIHFLVRVKPVDRAHIEAENSAAGRAFSEAI